MINTMNMQELKQLIYEGEKVDVECKEAEYNMPKSVYESYSAFANTKGGYIILGVKENKTKKLPEERFVLQGTKNSKKQVEDFWNTINSGKVNVNILRDEDVFVVEEHGICLIVIRVLRADYKMRPVYVGENPYKGTFKRNNEGDFHATKYEVDGMIRDKNPDGNDGMILEYYTMDDVDKETLRKYRQIFEVRNDGHVWNSLDDKSFLEKLGGYKRHRREEKEGLTLAGLLMFGNGLAIRDEFDNIFMDFRDESEVTSEIRWNDRVTYDGTWENNLFNFFIKVTPKLIGDLKRPFKLEGIQRIDETSVHKAVREGFVNLIIHADYLLDTGTLKVIKRADGFEFTNPGILKLPLEDIYQGGNSKPRNPRMQTMLRMVGFGDNAGSGFPAILSAWKTEGWIEPELVENTRLNQVVLTMKMTPEWINKLNDIPFEEYGSRGMFLKRMMPYMAFYSKEQVMAMIDGLKSMKERQSASDEMACMADGILEVLKETTKKLAEKEGESAEKSAESAEKSAESAEKSAESERERGFDLKELSKRQKQILDCMEQGKPYSTNEVAQLVGLKDPRTRQLLNELVEMGLVICNAATKNRRYIKR